jgi:hypothetical protein
MAMLVHADIPLAPVAQGWRVAENHSSGVDPATRRIARRLDYEWSV